MMCEIVPSVKIYIDFFRLSTDYSQNRKPLTFCLLVYLNQSFVSSTLTCMCVLPDLQRMTACCFLQIICRVDNWLESLLQDWLVWDV